MMGLAVVDLYLDLQLYLTRSTYVAVTCSDGFSCGRSVFRPPTLSHQVNVCCSNMQ